MNLVLATLYLELKHQVEQVLGRKYPFVEDVQPHSIICGLESCAAVVLPSLHVANQVVDNVMRLPQLGTTSIKLRKPKAVSLLKDQIRVLILCPKPLSRGVSNDNTKLARVGGPNWYHRISVTLKQLDQAVTCTQSSFVIRCPGGNLSG